MSDERSMLQELISSLKQQRDELALQIHLGRAEAKEEWNKLQDKIRSLSKQYEPVKDVLGETSSEVLSGLKLIAEEVSDGLARIRKML